MEYPIPSNRVTTTTKQLIPLSFNYFDIEEVNIIVMDEIVFLVNSEFQDSNGFSERGIKQ